MSVVIQWYPGHMFKAKKEIISQLKNIDLVIEIIDSRVPISSHNEMLDELTNNKEKLLVFSKMDLVNKPELEKHYAYYEDSGYQTIGISCNNVVDRKKLLKKINDVTNEIKTKFANKGINKTIRILVMGMPNVGKSTIINFLSQQRKTNVGNKPGVTKQQQWIKLDNNIEVLDTPGILIPKIVDITRGFKLVCCSLIKEEVVELEHVAIYLLEYLYFNKQRLLFERYNIKNVDEYDVEKIYDQIAISIGAIFSKNDYDYDRVTSIIINDFRKQKFGNIILD